MTTPQQRYNKSPKGRRRTRIYRRSPKGTQRRLNWERNKFNQKARGTHRQTIGEKAAYQRAYRLKRYFGTDADEYNRLLEAQGGHCALCQRTPAGEVYGVLCIDHDQYGVRGLLCRAHNIALGKFGDNETGLRKALNYVMRKGEHHGKSFN